MDQHLYQSRVGTRAISLSPTGKIHDKTSPAYGTGGHNNYYNFIQNYETGQAYQGINMDQERRLDEALRNEKAQMYLHQQQNEQLLEKQEQQRRDEQRFLRQLHMPNSSSQVAATLMNDFEHTEQAGYAPMHSMPNNQFHPAMNQLEQQQQLPPPQPIPQQQQYLQPPLLQAGAAGPMRYDEQQQQQLLSYSNQPMAKAPMNNEYVQEPQPQTFENNQMHVMQTNRRNITPNGEEVMAKNFHYKQFIHQEPPAAEEQPPPPKVELKPAAVNLASPPQQHCFATSHKFCSPKQYDNNSNPKTNQNLDHQLRQFDKGMTQFKHKNNDHFHLVQAQEVYENLNKPYQENQGLTATIYSNDSHQQEQQKQNRYKYAQVLIEQMKVQKENKLKEQAQRKAVAADLDVREKLGMIKIPDIPSLPEQKLAGNNNFGFFDKFYGPEKVAEQLKNKHRYENVQDDQSAQMNERYLKSIQDKNQQMLEEQRMLNEQLIIQNRHFQDQIRKLTQGVVPLQSLPQQPPVLEMGAGPASGQGYADFMSQQQDFQSQMGLAHKQPAQALQQDQQLKHDPTQQQEYLSPRLLVKDDIHRGGFSPPHIGLDEKYMPAGASPNNLSHKRHLSPETIKFQFSKDQYKDELRIQMQEKKERELREKQLKYQEDLQEEQRIRREVDELNRQYQEHGSEREGVTQKQFTVDEYKDPFFKDGLLTDYNAEELKQVNAKYLNEAKLKKLRSVQASVKPGSKQEYQILQEAQHPQDKIIKSKTLTAAANLTELQAIEKKFQHHSLLNDVGVVIPKINMDAVHGDERPIQPSQEQLMTKAQAFKKQLHQLKENHGDLRKRYQYEMEQLREIREKYKQGQDIKTQLVETQEEVTRLTMMMKESEKAMADKSRQIETQDVAAEYVETVRESEVAEHEEEQELAWEEEQKKRDKQAEMEAEKEAAPPEKELESLSQLQKQITVNFNPNEFEKENPQPVVMSQRSLGGRKNPSRQLPPLEPTKSLKSQHSQQQLQSIALINKNIEEFKTNKMSKSRRMSLPKLHDEMINLDKVAKGNLVSTRRGNEQKRFDFEDFVNHRKTLSRKSSGFQMPPNLTKSSQKYQSVSGKMEQNPLQRKASIKNLPPIPISKKKSSLGLLSRDQVVVNLAEPPAPEIQHNEIHQYEPYQVVVQTGIDQEATNQNEFAKQAIGEDVPLVQTQAAAEQPPQVVELHQQPPVATETLALELPTQQQQHILIGEDEQQLPAKDNVEIIKSEVLINQEETKEPLEQSHINLANEVHEASFLPTQNTNLDQMTKEQQEEVQASKGKPNIPFINPIRIQLARPNEDLKGEQLRALREVQMALAEDQIEEEQKEVGIECLPRPPSLQVEAEEDIRNKEPGTKSPTATGPTVLQQFSVVNHSQHQFNSSNATKAQQFEEEQFYQYELANERYKVEILSLESRRQEINEALTNPEQKANSQNANNKRAQSEVAVAQAPGSPVFVDNYQLRAQNRRSQVQDEIRQMAERVEEAVNFIESINVKEEERKFKSVQIQKNQEQEEIEIMNAIQEDQKPTIQPIQAIETTIQLHEPILIHTQRQMSHETQKEMPIVEPMEQNPSQKQYLISEVDQVNFSEYQKELKMELQIIELQQEQELQEQIRQKAFFEKQELEQRKAEENRTKKMEQVLGFVNTKKLNNESIFVKKISTKKQYISDEQRAANQGSQSHVFVKEQMLYENEIEPQLFEQRANLREAIKETNIEKIDLNRKNFYDQSTKKLYAEDPDVRAEGSLSRSLTRKAKLPPRVPVNNDYLYKQTNEKNLFELNIDQVEQNEMTGIFTQDSKINEYPRVNSFYEKQQQFQEIAFKNHKPYKFGCYGPVSEAGEGNAQTEIDKEIYQQKTIKYNKNDPFGVNMRLRQSLSNTNKILFRQDSHRYLQNPQLTQKPEGELRQLMPKTSKQLLEELNMKKAVNDLLDWDAKPIDTNLYRDDGDQIADDQEAASEKKQVKFQLQTQFENDLEPNFDFGDATEEQMAANEMLGAEYQADAEAAFYTEDNEEF